MNRSSYFYRLMKPKLFSSSSSFSVLKRLYHTNVPIGSIDIPSVKDTEPFRITNTAVYTSWTNKIDKTSCQILGPGIILLKNYVSIHGQVIAWSMYDKYRVCSKGYLPLIRYRLCFGRNWDPISGYLENHCRSDGTEPLLLPYGFIHLAREALADAKVLLHQLPFPEMCPDICVADFYSISYQFCSLQQDRDESFASLISGSPVISVFIGDTAKFLYGYTSVKNKLSEILLESGDVLIYGGKSRLIFHLVEKIIKETAPLEFRSRRIGLASGCLNLNFKQF